MKKPFNKKVFGDCTPLKYQLQLLEDKHANKRTEIDNDPDLTAKERELAHDRNDESYRYGVTKKCAEHLGVPVPRRDPYK